MKKMLLFVLTVGVAVAAVNSRGLLPRTGLPENSPMSQAGNAAFRDGLHLGKFDATSGRTGHLSVGRWSSDTNRAWFIAGYQAGYRQVNAVKAAGD
ncbi:MAG: hypothetical protein WBX03_19280 [Terriglobales bacterium]|jgi:hypothetical protein